MHSFTIGFIQLTIWIVLCGVGFSLKQPVTAWIYCFIFVQFLGSENLMKAPEMGKMGNSFFRLKTTTEFFFLQITKTEDDRHWNCLSLNVSIANRFKIFGRFCICKIMHFLCWLSFLWIIRKLVLMFGCNSFKERSWISLRIIPTFIYFYFVVVKYEIELSSWLLCASLNY